MSASTNPTLSPKVTRASARLAASVDLPTPPLPDATATRCLTPGMGRGPFVSCGATGFSAVNMTRALVMPGSVKRTDSAAALTGSKRAASCVPIRKVSRAIPPSTDKVSIRPLWLSGWPAGSKTVDKASAAAVVALMNRFDRLRQKDATFSSMVGVAL